MKTECLILALPAAMAFALASCSGAAPAGSKAETFATTSGITQVEVNQLYKSISAVYRVDSVENSAAYLSVNVDVEWPTRIGNADLTALQDSIIGLFNVDSTQPRPASIDEGMLRAAATTFYYGYDSVTPVKTIPAATSGLYRYYSNTAIKLADITPAMVSVMSVNTMFTGGAHPNTAISLFTYDLKQGRVITPAVMFRPGTEAQLTQAVRSTIASTFGLSDSTLTRAGFFSNDIPVSPIMTVSPGAVVFHYNPYDIAPYSFGPINVAVPDSALTSILTPEGAALLKE